MKLQHSQLSMIISKIKRHYGSTAPSSMKWSMIIQWNWNMKLIYYTVFNVIVNDNTLCTIKRPNGLTAHTMKWSMIILRRCYGLIAHTMKSPPHPHPPGTYHPFGVVGVDVVDAVFAFQGGAIVFLKECRHCFPVKLRKP